MHKTKTLLALVVCALLVLGTAAKKTRKAKPAPSEGAADGAAGAGGDDTVAELLAMIKQFKTRALTATIHYSEVAWEWAQEVGAAALVKGGDLYEHIKPLVGSTVEKGLAQGAELAASATAAAGEFVSSAYGAAAPTLAPLQLEARWARVQAFAQAQFETTRAHFVHTFKPFPALARNIDTVSTVCAVAALLAPLFAALYALPFVVGLLSSFIDWSIVPALLNVFMLGLAVSAYAFKQLAGIDDLELLLNKVGDGNMDFAFLMVAAELVLVLALHLAALASAFSLLQAAQVVGTAVVAGGWMFTGKDVLANGLDCPCAVVDVWLALAALSLVQLSARTKACAAAPAGKAGGKKGGKK